MVSAMNESTPSQDELNEQLRMAARAGSLDVINDCLRQGANIETTETSGRYAGATPLMLASQSGRAEAVSLLIQQGANVEASNEFGRTALIEAVREARKGTIGCVDALLEGGANINQQDLRGYTAIMHASQGGHRDLVLHLYNRAARTDIKTADGADILTVAKRSIKQELTILVEKRNLMQAAHDAREAVNLTDWNEDDLVGGMIL